MINLRMFCLPIRTINPQAAPCGKRQTQTSGPSF